MGLAGSKSFRAGAGWPNISTAQTASESDEAEVRALNQRLMEAFNKKEVTAVMACYSDNQEAIFFEEPIPFQLNKAELTKASAMKRGR
jgi:ketosteroid isomerase-like protein